MSDKIKEFSRQHPETLSYMRNLLDLVDSNDPIQDASDIVDEYEMSTGLTGIFEDKALYTEVICNLIDGYNNGNLADLDTIKNEERYVEKIRRLSSKTADKELTRLISIIYSGPSHKDHGKTREKLIELTKTRFIP